LISTPPDIF